MLFMQGFFVPEPWFVKNKHKVIPSQILAKPAWLSGGPMKKRLVSFFVLCAFVIPLFPEAFPLTATAAGRKLFGNFRI